MFAPLKRKLGMRGVRQRALLRVGDRVAVVGPLGRIIVATVQSVLTDRVAVALSPQFVVEYRIKDGVEIGKFPVTRLRDPATRKEFDALEHPVVPKKTRWTPERIARAQARAFRQFGWPQVMAENVRHRKDEPGMHVDQGNYARQLRYHDSDGILRGRLLHFQAGEAGGKPVDKWDCHRGQYEEAGNILVEVDPKKWRKGIGTALLNEAFRLRWRINLDKQGRTLAGAPFLRTYRERSGL